MKPLWVIRIPNTFSCSKCLPFAQSSVRSTWSRPSIYWQKPLNTLNMRNAIQSNVLSPFDFLQFTHIYTHRHSITPACDWWVKYIGINSVLMWGVIMFCRWTITLKLSQKIHPTFRGVLIYLGLMIGIWASLGLDFTIFFQNFTLFQAYICLQNIKATHLFSTPPY